MEDVPLTNGGSEPLSAASLSSSSSTHNSFHFDLDNEDLLADERSTLPVVDKETQPSSAHPHAADAARAPVGAPVTSAIGPLHSGSTPICRVEMPAVMRTGQAPRSSRGGDNSSRSGSDSERSSRSKPSGLVSKNYHVLTPDKRVMLSLPPDCIVPTAGSEKYLERNKNKLIFSFCLCYVYSLGATCHHGSSCDFIHCMPDKLPQVVNMAPLQREDVKRASGDIPDDGSESSSPDGSSSEAGAAAVRSFPVHWSTPVTNLENALYARLPAGRQLYVKENEPGRNDSGGHGGTRVIPSELLYETVGSRKAMDQVNGNVPLRFCKHYRREKCARGPLCHFVHPVVLAEPAALGNVVYDLGSVPQGSALLDSLSVSHVSGSSSPVLPAGRDDGSDAQVTFLASRSGSDSSATRQGNPLSIQQVQAPPAFRQQLQAQTMQAFQRAPQFHPQMYQAYPLQPLAHAASDRGNSPVDSYHSSYAAFTPQNVSVVASSRTSSPLQGYVSVIMPASPPRSPTFSGHFVSSQSVAAPGFVFVQPAGGYNQGTAGVPVITEMHSAVTVSVQGQQWASPTSPPNASVRPVPGGVQQPTFFVPNNGSSRGGSLHLAYPGQYGPSR